MSVSRNLRFVVAYQYAALDALGDPTRRAIFERLGHGPSAVSELARALPVSRPAVSQHLAVLKEANLVLDETIGTRHLYRLNPQAIDALRTYFHQFWTHALAEFQAIAESEE